MAEDKISVGLELDTSYYDKQMDEASKKLDQFGKQLDNPFKLDIDLGADLFQKAAGEVEFEIQFITGMIDNYKTQIESLSKRLENASKGYELAKKAEDEKDQAF